MELFAAVDIKGGGAVRLVRGELDHPTPYGDPVALARRYLDGGARWLHVVDLDAAATGTSANRGQVLELVGAAKVAGARVEVGGGIRDDDDVEDLVGAGADRVVLGTAAVQDPSFAVRAARRHPGRVAVGLDYRYRGAALEAAVRGWTESSDRTVADVLTAVAGEPVAAVVVTAIDRDGTLDGPDAAGLSQVLDLTALPVVASGGVGGPADLKLLKRLRSPGAGRELAGVVVGKALAAGSMSVEEAVTACAVSG